MMNSAGQPTKRRGLSMQVESLSEPPSPPGAGKLTESQRRDLKKLSDKDHFIKTRSCTNSTLSALERRGLAKIEVEMHESIPDYRVLRWYITDAGRAALKTGAE